MRGQLELTPSYAAQLEGKILANAHAEGDVDGDGATELVFGTTTGNVSLFKVVDGHLTLWRSCEVDGSVTALCLEGSGDGEMRVIVATAEGKCSVFRSVQDAGVLQLCSTFNAALNICDVAHWNGELVIATRDGRIFIYQRDVERLEGDELTEYSQVAQLEIAGEIESLVELHSSSDASNQLLARSFLGETFCVGAPSQDGPVDKREVVPWNGPPHDDEGITFVVGDVEMGDGASAMVANVSMTGLVSLFSSFGERQWDVQLPEAAVGAGKLEMTTATGDRQDAIVVCTWSGQLYAIQSERKLVRFRMLLPASSMFCVSIRDSCGQTDPTIVGVSTSGTFFVFRDVQETLLRELQDSTLSDKMRRSSVFEQMNTAEKRDAIMGKLRVAFPQLTTTATTSPTVEELICAMLATSVEL